MARKKENSKKFIISCRVDDDEMMILRQRACEEGISISQLLRTCLDFAACKTPRQSFSEIKQAC